MKKTGEQKIYIQANNIHLLNILEDNYYMELGVVNISVIEKLLNNQVLDLSQLIYYEILNSGIGQITNNPSSDIYYQLNYLLSLRQKSSSNKFYLTCGTIAYFDDLGNERYAPVVLIPIEIDYKNGRVTCAGSAVVNRLLIKLLSRLCHENKEEQNKFTDAYLNAPLTSVRLIDKLIQDLGEESNLAYSPSNFLTVCKVEYSDFTINKNFFNVERSMYETESETVIKNYFTKVKSILPTNIDQKYTILKASMGENFAVDGKLGAGKTYTILNIIADFIAKGKKILYVNQDLDNVWDLEKNLRFLDLEHYVVNLTKSLRDINVPKMNLPQFSNTDFKLEDLEIITRFEKGLDEKTNGFSVRYMLETLSILRNSEEMLIPIEIEENLQKYEVDKLYNDLRKVEESILITGKYTDNIWKRLNISHNNITKEEIIDRAINLNKIHFILIEEIKQFCKKYKIILPKNMMDLSRLISHIISFSSIRPLAIWQNQQIRQDAIYALTEIQDMSDNNFSALNYYETNISTDYTPGRAKAILKDLSGKYLKIKYSTSNDDAVYLDRLLSNDTKIQSYIDQIDSTIREITEIEKLINDVFDTKDLSKRIDIGYYNFFVNYANFLSNNFILRSWSNIAIESLKTYKSTCSVVKNAYEKASKIRDTFEKYLINEKDLSYEIIEELLKNKQCNKLIKRSFDSTKLKKDHVNVNDLIINVKDYYATLSTITVHVVDSEYSGNKTIEEQIESYINFYDLVSSLDEPYYELLKKSLIKKSKYVVLDLEHTYSVLKSFKDESEKLDVVAYNLSEYKIGVNGLFGFDKKNDLLSVKEHLRKSLLLKQELTTIFKLNTTINTKILLELIKYDAQYLAAQKTLKDKDYVYRSLLGDNYKGFDTILGVTRQTLEHFDDFVSRLNSDSDIDALFTNDNLDSLIEDGFKLRDHYNEWINMFRTFSLCFKGGKNNLQENNLDIVSNEMKLFNETLEQIEPVLFINETLKKCKSYQLFDLSRIIEQANPGDLIANSYLLSTLTKLYNQTVVKKPYILDFANYENTLEKYLNFEIDYCTQNIIALQKKEERKSKVNIKEIKFTEYDKVISNAPKYTQVFLIDLNIFNSNFSLEPFDLVIIDDGHLSSANKYTRIKECKQCIVFGDKSFRRSIVNTLMQRIDDRSIIQYRNRYIRMSSKFNNLWTNNNRYIFNFDTKIVKQMVNSPAHFAQNVVTFFMKNTSHIINVVVGNEKSRREIYSNIVAELEKMYSNSEIIEILCYNIRIINALDEGSRYVNDVMVYYNDFLDMEVNQKELIFKNFIVVSSGIYIYYVGTKIETQNNEMLKDITLTIGRAHNIAKKSSGISKLLLSRLKEKELVVKEGFGYFDIIVEDKNTIAVMIIGRETSEDYSLLDEYNYYYREYQRNGWIVEIIYVGDLINHFEEAVNDIIRIAKEVK